MTSEAHYVGKLMRLVQIRNRMFCQCDTFICFWWCSCCLSIHYSLGFFLLYIFTNGFWCKVVMTCRWYIILCMIYVWTESLISFCRTAHWWTKIILHRFWLYIDIDYEAFIWLIKNLPMHRKNVLLIWLMWWETNISRI